MFFGWFLLEQMTAPTLSGLQMSSNSAFFSGFRYDPIFVRDIRVFRYDPICRLLEQMAAPTSSGLQMSSNIWERRIQKMFGRAPEFSCRGLPEDVSS